MKSMLFASAAAFGDIWSTAWLAAPEDTYLERELQQRAAAAAKQK
jgi:hypothetical protein